mmetsp:Transcript_3055/g.10998  ORF Transcript_3055/g.10998 Transcript_3055/m.10998 type:complete len:218 (-) Transcript_3055:277-930(-)
MRGCLHRAAPARAQSVGSMAEALPDLIQARQSCRVGGEKAPPRIAKGVGQARPLRGCLLLRGCCGAGHVRNRQVRPGLVQHHLAGHVRREAHQGPQGRQGHGGLHHLQHLGQAVQAEVRAHAGHQARPKHHRASAGRPALGTGAPLRGGGRLRPSLSVRTLGVGLLRGAQAPCRRWPCRRADVRGLRRRQSAPRGLNQRALAHARRRPCHSMRVLVP